MTIRGGFVTKHNADYFLVARTHAIKISRLAGVNVDGSDFVPFYKLTPSEKSMIDAASA
jgi:hypothetical protein